MPSKAELGERAERSLLHSPAMAETNKKTIWSVQKEEKKGSPRIGKGRGYLTSAERTAVARIALTAGLRVCSALTRGERVITLRSLRTGSTKG